MVRRLRKRFGNGPSNYQMDVNNLTGAMGPTNTAFWAKDMATTGKPWLLSAQPLYYSPSIGRYVTSFEQNAAPMSVSVEKLPGTWTTSVGPTPSTGPAFGRRKRRSRSFGRRRRRFGRRSFGSCGPCGGSLVSFGKKHRKRSGKRKSKKSKRGKKSRRRGRKSRRKSKKHMLGCVCKKCLPPNMKHSKSCKCIICQK